MGAPPTAVTSDSESALYIELIAIKYFFFVFFLGGHRGPMGSPPPFTIHPGGPNIKQPSSVKLTLNLTLSRFRLKNAEIV